ncbi:major facilitator superfamily domain-containing protein [Apiosordaria backusii]|uniref:Major facilitator superfamily domain-containing protein n=1 Tax=Apiosordaria backusii TaxID=314023 RepID=A0AA40BJJ6_9PEZI|nr:major facilitator superfamily domain-containing protein [Apiosordaria backusii]
MEKGQVEEKVTPLRVTSSSSSSSRSGSRSHDTLSLASSHGHDQENGSPPENNQQQDYIVVSFTPDDPENPYNWSMKKKSLLLLCATLTCLNSTMGSTIASANLFPLLSAEFNVPAGPQSVLPASLYLIGFCFGPIIFAPLSESYGRKPILVTGFLLFVASTAGASVAPSWWSFLLMRFLCGTFGSPPLSVFGGVIADCFGEEVQRGRMLMVWSAATFIGPLGAPVLGGFVGGVLGWRWVFWIALIFAGVTALSVVIIPETLASKILKRKAERLNKLHQGEEGGRRYVAPGELCQKSVLSTLVRVIQKKTTLLRPLELLCGEMVVILTSLYIAFIYSVFYMMVQMYYAIFVGVYGFSPGVSGLMFTIIGVGTIIGCFICWWCDPITVRLSAKHPTKRAEYLRLPLACIGGPFFVASILWIGLSARPDVHWAVPLVATYVADAYGIYSASALAALGTTRSIAGALLPLAIEDMLEALGIAKSCALLAGISAILAAVPFCFVAYGDKIRARSKFSTALKNKTRQQEGTLARTTSHLSAV